MLRLAAALSIVASTAAAKNNAFTSTRHGDPLTGPQRLTDVPRGSCAQCHVTHGSHQGGAPSFERLLFAPADNNLCFTCHETASANLVFPGRVFWSQSAHAQSAAMYWPGPAPPARSFSDANECVNCHEPHGEKDGAGVIPSMLAVREQNLCYACHDGARAPNVRAEFAKSYRHPITVSALHGANEQGDPVRFAATPVNRRHSECADCHNAHEAQRNAGDRSAPDVPATLIAVGRVQVTNGIAGSMPIYTWRGPDETSFGREYEICFKCHSSWTRQPVGQSNLALLTNPANPSFHPVQQSGRNRNIDPNAFVSGWSWASLTYCSDCHTSDDPTMRGPHGSSFRYILKKEYTASPLARSMVPAEICFDCHNYNVYALASSGSTVQRASRFNSPATSQGHAFHVGQGYPCYSCHETHGSTRYPALIATGRSPGINSYAQAPGGGTCTPTCHGTVTYTVNYAR